MKKKEIILMRIFDNPFAKYLIYKKVSERYSAANYIITNI